MEPVYRSGRGNQLAEEENLCELFEPAYALNWDCFTPFSVVFLLFSILPETHGVHMSQFLLRHMNPFRPSLVPRHGGFIRFPLTQVQN
jgi:hypothetical protein